MWNKKKSRYLLLMIACSGSLNAENLVELYTLARQHDPLFYAQQSAFYAKETATPQARAQLLPQISANGTQSYMSGAQGMQYTLLMTQPIFHYDHWIQYQAAHIQVKQARALFATAEQDLLLRTATRYFGLLQAQDNLHFAQAKLTALKRYLDQTQQRFKAGMIANLDVQAAQARYDSAQAQALSAEQQVSDQQDLLTAMIGQRVNTVSILHENMVLSEPVPARVEDWVKLSIAHNVLVQAARLGSEQAKTEIVNTQAKHLPTLDVVGSRAQTPQSVPARVNSVGLRLSLPIFSGGGMAAKTREAMHLYQKAVYELDVALAQAETHTRTAYRGILSQISQVSALKQAVLSNKTALAATESAYQVGTRTIVDLLNAQSDLINAQKEYSAARYAYILSTLTLKQAIGSLTLEDLQQINQFLEKV